MKYNSKQGPDLQTIIEDLTGSARTGNREGELDNNNHPATEHQGRLWDDFLEFLNEKDSDVERSKLYAIDDDIVETLHQCNFGQPNVHVINSILRTFLVDNIPKLKEMYRPRSKSILDKYE